MRFLVLILALGLAGCGGGAGGPVGAACANSGRDAANARLCGCIQRAASQTLRAGEQRRAADFFANPDLAQEARARSSSDGFWRRYRRFAERAEASCR